MKIIFLRPAEKELDEAFKYYESVQESLGLKFQAEVAHSLSRIVVCIAHLHRKPDFWVPREPQT